MPPKQQRETVTNNTRPTQLDRTNMIDWLIGQGLPGGIAPSSGGSCKDRGSADPIAELAGLLTSQHEGQSFSPGMLDLLEGWCTKNKYQKHNLAGDNPTLTRILPKDNPHTKFITELAIITGGEFLYKCFQLFPLAFLTEKVTVHSRKDDGDTIVGVPMVLHILATRITPTTNKLSSQQFQELPDFFELVEECYRRAPDLRAKHFSEPLKYRPKGLGEVTSIPRYFTCGDLLGQYVAVHNIAKKHRENACLRMQITEQESQLRGQARNYLTQIVSLKRELSDHADHIAERFAENLSLAAALVEKKKGHEDSKRQLNNSKRKLKLVSEKLRTLFTTNANNEVEILELRSKNKELEGLIKARERQLEQKSHTDQQLWEKQILVKKLTGKVKALEDNIKVLEDNIKVLYKRLRTIIANHKKKELRLTVSKPTLKSESSKQRKALARLKENNAKLQTTKDGQWLYQQNPAQCVHTPTCCVSAFNGASVYHHSNGQGKQGYPSGRPHSAKVSYSEPSADAAGCQKGTFSHGSVVSIELEERSFNPVLPTQHSDHSAVDPDELMRVFTVLKIQLGIICELTRGDTLYVGLKGDQQNFPEQPHADIDIILLIKTETGKIRALTPDEFDRLSEYLNLPDKPDSTFTKTFTSKRSKAKYISNNGSNYLASNPKLTAICTGSGSIIKIDCSLYTDTDLDTLSALSADSGTQAFGFSELIIKEKQCYLGHRLVPSSCVDDQGLLKLLSHELDFIGVPPNLSAHDISYWTKAIKRAKAVNGRVMYYVAQLAVKIMVDEQTKYHYLGTISQFKKILAEWIADKQRQSSYCSPVHLVYFEAFNQLWSKCNPSTKPSSLNSDDATAARTGWAASFTAQPRAVRPPVLTSSESLVKGARLACLL